MPGEGGKKNIFLASKTFPHPLSWIDTQHLARLGTFETKVATY